VADGESVQDARARQQCVRNIVAGRFNVSNSHIASLLKLRYCCCKSVNCAHCAQEASGFQHLSAPLQDLLGRVLKVDPSQRITTAAIASHPWLAQAQGAPSSCPLEGGGQDSRDAGGEDTTARDWSTFWPDAESLAGGAGAGAGTDGAALPTSFSFGSDDSWGSMGAYHACSGFARGMCFARYVM
jgi:serine/threonine protein kinase